MGRNIDGLAPSSCQSVLNFELVVLVFIVVVVEVHRIVFVTAIVRDVVLTTAIEDLVGLFYGDGLLLTELTGEALVAVQDVVALVPGPE